MTPSRNIFSILAVLTVFAALLGPGGPARAQPEEPCVELRFGGKDALEIPCPEGLAEILDLPFFAAPPEENDNFAVNPDLPDDRDMLIDPEWRHDEGIVRRPNTE